ncbi:hypothetical protein DF196_01110 [Bifidobacterium callitrichidarum]|uniref:Carotenoid biosynthesis protein n=3 Tax=Bifidobacterium TaxID=1678 RepID=A0A6L9SSV9_9BIFI|nr:carotenoid biosynthesis protein [Bifidobacterium platyrrhinorum]PWG66855.1 hypothetical protein DF196_01110 [Bifidobacterium callitrichidarum]
MGSQDSFKYQLTFQEQERTFNMDNKQMQIRKAILDKSWIICVVAVIGALISAILMPDKGPIPAFVIMFFFAIVHGNARYGWKNMLIFFAIYFVLSMCLETCSTITGFPFGAYSYTAVENSGNVSFGVGIFYFDLGYLSWTIASILLDGADWRLDKKINLFAMPIVASTVMTVVDLATDFTSSTVQHIWNWGEGGGFYGVPYTNFLGWSFVTWLCAQVFAFVLRRQQENILPTHNKRNFLWPVLAYGSMGLNLIIVYFVPGETGTVMDERGVAWQISDMREAALLIAFYTVVFIAVLALFKMGRGDLKEKPDQEIANQ